MVWYCHFFASSYLPSKSAKLECSNWQDENDTATIGPWAPWQSDLILGAFDTFHCVLFSRCFLCCSYITEFCAKLHCITLRHELHFMLLQCVTKPQYDIQHMRTRTQICSFGSVMSSEIRTLTNIDSRFSFGTGDFALFLGVQAESPRSQAASAAIEYV